MLRPLRVIDLASKLTRYTAGLSLQDSIAHERKQGLVPDTLLLLQHYPVYTLGKRGTSADFRRSREELESTGAEICEVPRGGEVTFHGPGQLVAYPILGVREARLGVRAYVEGLEDVLVSCLARYGISARGRVPGATGVWVGERKIAAIGVRISQGISTHGIALNVSTDLSYFNHIVPCGIPDKDVTSVARELQLARRLPEGREPGQERWAAAGGAPELLLGPTAKQEYAAGSGIEQVPAPWLRPGQEPVQPGRGAGLPEPRAGSELGGLLGSGIEAVPVVSRQGPPEFGQVVRDFEDAFRQRLGFELTS